MSRILDDIRHALRRLAATPGFTIAAVLLLATGIGGSTLVFSVVDAVLLKSLPVKAPEQLARIVVLTHNRPPVSEYPFAVFDQWRQRSKSFSSAFAQTDIDVAYSDTQNSRPVRAQIVTGSYYAALGVAPLLGRLLVAQDEWAAGDQLPAVLSYHFWQRQFHLDPAVLGKVIHLAGEPFVVVGVTRPEFNGLSVDSGPDLQLPFIAGQFLTASGKKLADPRRCCLWEIAGRLRPHVALAGVQIETSAAMQSAWEAVYLEKRPLSDEDRNWIRRQTIQVQPLGRGVSWLRQKFSTGLTALMAAALCLLLLACANVAAMLLARAASQEHQNAIRLALGASRRRLMRQWLTDGALLAVAGGLAAILFTRAALPLLSRSLPPLRGLDTRQLPVALHIELDTRVFLCALLLCCASTILAALGPAWHSAQADLMAPLKAANSNFRRTRLRLFLVAAQVAVCTMVVANAGLLLQTLRKLEVVNPGFRSDHVLTFTVDTGLQRYDPPRTYALAERLLQDTRNLPGIASAAIAVKPLLRGAGMRMSITPIDGQPRLEELNTDSNVVTPGYFETLGMKLIAGRLLNLRDGGSRPSAPVVVNETFASTFFPGRNAVGRFFDSSDSPHLIPRYEIVGVIADSKYRSLREAPFPAVFSCLTSAEEMDQFHLLVRTKGDSQSALANVPYALRRIDPGLPFSEIHTLSEEFETSLWAEHTLVQVGLIFATLATLLAAIGLYGLLSYVVVERAKEIGLRIALGARPIDIIRATALRLLALVGVGVLFGLPGSILTAASLRNLLFGVSPLNMKTQGAAAAVVVLSAAVAVLWPLARIARVDPASTLRHI